VTEVLAAAAIVAGWIIFRLDRRAQSKATVAHARALLNAVREGIVEGAAGQSGWGETYFSKVYDAREAALRATEDRRAIEGKSINQVFAVPTEPLAALATATGPGAELISQRTLIAANVALWRVRVFNQFVEMQSSFHVRHLTEIVDPNTGSDRRRALGVAADVVSTFMHGSGIGGANLPGGWYHELKEAVAENVANLDDRARRTWPGPPGERYLALGDLAVVGILSLATVAAFCDSV
jgi:hypothetical protein